DAPIWDSYGTTFVYDVWELGYKGQGVTIAIADTGIDITHPELAGAMGGVGPFHEGYWAEFDENGFLVPGSMPRDTDTHGTWVAEQGRDVINRSFGANTIHLDVAIATDNLAAAGVVPVFANGNW